MLKCSQTANRVFARVSGISEPSVFCGFTVCLFSQWLKIILFRSSAAKAQTPPPIRTGMRCFPNRSSVARNLYKEVNNSPLRAPNGQTFRISRSPSLSQHFWTPILNTLRVSRGGVQSQWCARALECLPACTEPPYHLNMLFAETRLCTLKQPK